MVKFAMALHKFLLYQKLDVIRSTIYVESFIIVSQSAQNAQFFCTMPLYYNIYIYIYIFSRYVAI